MGPLHSAHPFALAQDVKPTIVFVSDAFFSHTAYRNFVAHLEQREYPIETIDPPSLATDSHPRAPAPSASVASDASFLRRNLLSRLVERDGLDVVLVAHGYGCRSALSAARLYHKATRFRHDLPGGILGIIGLSPIILQEGARLELEGQSLPQWALRDTVSFMPHDLTCLLCESS